MREKTILIILIAILITRSAVSQINDCLKDFDFVIKKIQVDYPGYNDKVTDVNRSQLMLLYSKKSGLQKITPESIQSYPSSESLTEVDIF